MGWIYNDNDWTATLVLCKTDPNPYLIMTDNSKSPDAHQSIGIRTPTKMPMDGDCESAHLTLRFEASTGLSLQTLKKMLPRQCSDFNVKTSGVGIEVIPTEPSCLLWDTAGHAYTATDPNVSSNQAHSWHKSFLWWDLEFSRGASGLWSPMSYTEFTFTARSCNSGNYLERRHECAIAGSSHWKSTFSASVGASFKFPLAMDYFHELAVSNPTCPSISCLNLVKSSGFCARCILIHSPEHLAFQHPPPRCPWLDLSCRETELPGSPWREYTQDPMLEVYRRPTRTKESLLFGDQSP